MIVRVFDDKKALGETAAEQASIAIRRAISAQGTARIIAATGMAQLDFLDALTRDENIDWQKVEMFHLDEYVGLPATHPASFCKYLLERLINKVGLTKYHLLHGMGDANETVRVVRRRCERRQWMSRLSVSEKTGTWRLTILLRISKPKTLTSSLSLMRPAVASRLAKDGLRIYQRFPGGQFLCPCDRS